MLAFFTMLMIHAHVFDSVKVGPYFAIGFLGAGLMIAMAAMNFVSSLIQEVGRWWGPPDQD